jgi:hypothetical protein
MLDDFAASIIAMSPARRQDTSKILRTMLRLCEADVSVRYRAAKAKLRQRLLQTPASTT